MPIQIRAKAAERKRIRDKVAVGTEHLCRAEEEAILSRDKKEWGDMAGYE
jgi:hypothetical protein